MDSVARFPSYKERLGKTGRFHRPFGGGERSFAVDAKQSCIVRNRVVINLVSRPGRPSVSSHAKSSNQRAGNWIPVCVLQPALHDRSRRCGPGNGPLQTHAQRSSGGNNALEGLLLATWRKDTNLIQQ